MRAPVISLTLNSVVVRLIVSDVVILGHPGVRLAMILLRTEGIPRFSFVLIYINLLAGSHQPRACSYKSRLTIASKCSLSGSLLPSPLLPYNPSIAPPDPILHVALSTLHPRLRTLRICHLHLRVACTRRKWGASQFREAHYTCWKGNIFLLLFLVDIC